MKKTMKKVLSVVLSLVMIVSSITIYNSTTVKAGLSDELKAQINNAEYNLALKKSVQKYPTEDPEGKKEILVDGIVDNKEDNHCALSSGWSYAGESYVVIDLGDYYEASSINRVMVQYKNKASDDTVMDHTYRLYYSVDGVDFGEPIYESNTIRENDFDVDNCIFTDVSQAAGVVRYVKIYYPATPTYGIQIDEIAIFSENPKKAVLEACDNAASVSVESNDYNEITYAITAGKNQEDYIYNVMLDGITQIGTGVSADQEYTASGIEAGTHTVTVVSIYQGKVSSGLVSDWVQVKDISEAYAGTKNIANATHNANSKIISVSSYYDGHSIDTAGVAIDGNISSGEENTLAVRTAVNTQPAEVVIDLGANYKKYQFEKVLIGYSNPRTYAATTVVSFSEDNDDYTAVASTTGYTCSKNDAGTVDTNRIEVDMTRYPKAGVRYVKLQLSGGANEWGYVINEIGVILNVDVENAEVVEEDNDGAYTAEQIATFKNDGSYPTETGKVFAGWYADKDYTTVYERGNGYAKFVDAAVLTVKAQITTPVEGTQNLRFVGAVATKDIQEAGFVFTGTYNGSDISEKTRTTKALYKNLLAGDTSYTATTVFETSDAAYFTTFVITGMDATVESTWSVTPYWITADGTKVTGTETKTFTVTNGDIDNEVKVQ